MEYALVNVDALWVFDEIQLMDVGLITSVQLQTFRQLDEHKMLRPTFTWWMSATLQSDWLETVNSKHLLADLKQTMLTIPPSERGQGILTTQKELQLEAIDKKDAQAMANLVMEAHNNNNDQGYGRITLAICNTVDRACELYDKLQKFPTDGELKLIHSRFRGKEKERWPDEFLSREHCRLGTNRIIVATQVVEAGVDISAGVLVTELAPWASLVQRFGRCARYGGQGRIIVVDRQFNEKDVAPYNLSDLTAAKTVLQQLPGVGIDILETFEEKADTETLKAIYPYEYLHLITAQEVEELFDTSPDLTGADIDISRFIRSGDERDVYVFWADVPENETPSPELQPLRRGLCAVPVGKIDAWLFKSGKFKDKHRAWFWDYLEGEWIELRPGMSYPGMTILVDLKTGGYDPTKGFTAKPSAKIEIDLNDTIQTSPDATELAQHREDRSVYPWKTIAFHSQEVASELDAILHTLALDQSPWQIALLRAASLHDWGKCHPAFAESITAADGHRPACRDLAKAPGQAWVPPRQMFRQSQEYGPRPGFRHELASTIACLEYLRLRQPHHPALLGHLREWIENGLLPEPPPPETQDDPLAITQLDETRFNLMLYLICTHHGKVRGSWQPTPHDQEFPIDAHHAGEGLPLRGVRED
ncbi:MAG: CRISPR-associated helicase Cas3', partial [Lentisphaerae bacterium]